VPCLVISPYARQNLVDHTQGDFTSFLKFIETVYSLPPLTNRDASANGLMEAFDFSQPPRVPLVLPGPFLPNHYPLTYPNETVFASGRPPQVITTTVSQTLRTTIIKNVTTTDTATVTANASTTTVAVPPPESLPVAYLVALGIVGVALVALPLWIRRTRQHGD
jgi:phospholipase C